MPIPIAPEDFPELMQIINLTYLDRVEKIESAQLNDDDSTICIAKDGRKKLAVKIDGEEIKVKLMGGEKAADELKFAAPSKKKKCSKGISCGASCINAANICAKSLSPAQKKQYEAFKTIVKGKEWDDYSPGQKGEHKRLQTLASGGSEKSAKKAFDSAKRTGERKAAGESLP